ncbi:MAG: TIGR02147 family protein, partial [Deltaproteobacteria bacterium]|nr:TIGR02147 family protein [Deltaproteobacteria bacterium]
MKPDLFSYSDYRIFLKDQYNYQKQKCAGRYSYRKFSEDLGFNASNFMHLVISAKRNLSTEAIQKISKAFRWSAQQKKFFHQLVLFNQAKNKKDKETHKAQLQKVLGGKRRLVDAEHFAYFSKWYIPVLRELVALKSFVSNLGWISKKLQPKVDQKDIRDALRVLEKLKMVELKNGKWHQSDEHLTTRSEVSSDLVYRYHEEQLELSKQSLLIPAEERDVSAMTMSLSEAQLRWVKQRVIEFRDEIQQELQGMEEDPTKVVQLNIQLFPVTK